MNYDRIFYWVLTICWVAMPFLGFVNWGTVVFVIIAFEVNNLRKKFN